MSRVSITVGPRSYTIRCDPGEEEKIARLGDLINEHYAKLGGARTTSEAQNLIFAALFMGDALLEEQTENKRLIAERTSEPPQGVPDAQTEKLAETLEALADRAERMASALEAGSRSP